MASPALPTPKPDRAEQHRRLAEALWRSDRAAELKLDLRAYWRRVWWRLAAPVLAFGGLAAEGALGYGWAAVCAAAACCAGTGSVLVRWLRTECSWIEKRLRDIEDELVFDTRAEVREMRRHLEAIREAMDAARRPVERGAVADAERRNRMVADAQALYAIMEGRESVDGLLCMMQVNYPETYARLEHWVVAQKEAAVN